MQSKPDFKLFTGRVVTHRMVSEDTQVAEVVGGGEMTAEEYAEYCDGTLPWSEGPYAAECDEIMGKSHHYGQPK